jgi:hypothetical protein
MEGIKDMPEGSYIKIEIKHYLNGKKVMLVMPYLEKRHLTKMEFQSAIEMLKEQKKNAPHCFD